MKPSSIIGEVKLDYYVGGSLAEEQVSWLIKELTISKVLGLTDCKNCERM